MYLRQTSSMLSVNLRESVIPRQFRRISHGCSTRDNDASWASDTAASITGLHGAGVVCDSALCSAGERVWYPGPGKNAVTAPVAQTLPARQVQVHVTPVPPISTAMRTAQRHLYLFSPSNVGLMLPAVDAHGNVWIGEMNANRLGRLNTQTGLVSSWTLLARRTVL